MTEEKIYIVLVLQLNGKENYSDGIVSFLFAADDVVKKYQLDEKARIFRPMVVVADRFDKDLDIFIDTQKNSRKCHRTDRGLRWSVTRQRQYSSMLQRKRREITS